LEGNLSKENARRESARSVIKLFSTYLKKNVVLVPEAKHIDEAFNIALEKGVPIYDALYIALAIGERAPSLALDEKQRSAAITARQSGL
jgi:predicted nucleic acid-binding protein